MRFYPGTTAMGWLTQTPSIVVQACITMLPRLEAQEHIAYVNRAAVASGRLEDAQARTTIRRWADTADGVSGEQRLTVPRAVVAEGVDTLAARGFHIVRVPKRRVS